MTTIRVTLTVFFAAPFWIGVFERQQGNTLEVAKVTFGSEPKDYEVYSFVLDHYHCLKFSPAVENVSASVQKLNPKRLQRQAKKQVEEVGIGTKAQQALKLRQEQLKLQRKENAKMNREAIKQQQFELRQKKRYEKHRGH